MSRSTKYFILYLFLFCLQGGCAKKIEKDIGGIKSNYKQQEEVEQQTENTEQSTEERINQMKYNSVDVVDGILQNPSKKINIAIVVPATGKYASVGRSIIESAMLTINKSKFEQQGTVNVYNIENLNGSNWQENKELQRMLKDNNDIIIGAGEKFEATTKKILSVIPEETMFISFINNNDIAKDYSNLIVVGVDDSYKIHSFFQYLKDYKKQFVSLVLPSTKKGYKLDKLFRKLAPNYEIFIVSTQFYQEKNKSSINTAVRGVSKMFTVQYMIDENGKFITETYKQNKDRKKQQALNAQNANENGEKIDGELQTQFVDVEAIYVDSNENDLLTILGGLGRFGILDKNVQIFSSAIFDLDTSDTTKLDNVLYLGYNYGVIDVFNKNFKNYFGHLPNYFSYITYDTLPMLFYVSSVGKMLPRYLFSDDGFRGMLDEFRITREGNIERRMSIYKLNNKIMSRVFIPDDYFSLKTEQSNNNVYFN